MIMLLAKHQHDMRVSTIAIQIFDFTRSTPHSDLFFSKPRNLLFTRRFGVAKTIASAPYGFNRGNP